MSYPVYIDDRSGSRELVRYRPLDATASLCRLESGDVMILGNGPDGTRVIGIEVKSIWDLLSSANTGRLQATQIPALVATYDVCWLLYYGTVRAGREGQLEIHRGNKGWQVFKIGKRAVPYGYLKALLFDFVCLGVSYDHVSDEREAAQWLGVLHRWWSKDWSAHRGMRTLDRSHDVSLMPGMDHGTHLRARIAAQLPGVGFERAIAAASHFPTVRTMVNAPADEWARVPGVGKGISKAIVRAVEE